MNKNSIVQFVGFVTNLDLDRFGTRWEHYAAQFPDRSASMTLQKAISGENKHKFDYLSQHECVTGNFRFNFMKERNSEHFPEHSAKVVQAGGYTPVQLQCTHVEAKGDVKVIAFIETPETDFGFYHRQTYRHLNIFEAYYENCLYNYIMEFFVQESEAAALVKQLRARPRVEAVIYKECSVLHFANTVS